MAIQSPFLDDHLHSCKEKLKSLVEIVKMKRLLDCEICFFSCLCHIRSA